MIKEERLEKLKVLLEELKDDSFGEQYYDQTFKPN